MLKRRLSQVLGAIAKGYAVDTLQGGFPVCQTEITYRAATISGVLAPTSLTASAQEITSGITSPYDANKEYRALSVTGNQASVYGSIGITGRDWAERKIVENIIVSGTGTIEGNKPFKYVDKIDLPVLAGAGDAVVVGVCDKIGLKRPIVDADAYKGLLLAGDSDDYFSPEDSTASVDYSTAEPDDPIVDGDSFQLLYETEIF